VTNEKLLDCPDPNPLTVIVTDCGMRNGGGCICEMPKGHEGEHRCPCGITFAEGVDMEALLKQAYKSMNYFGANMKIYFQGDTADG
jgi:hypothetical protein